MSTVNLRIEHLVLDGLALKKRDGPPLRAAIEAELARLLGEGENEWGAHRPEPVVRGARLPATGPQPEALGAAIASSIHASLPQ